MCFGSKKASAPAIPPAEPIPAPSRNVETDMQAARSDQATKAAASGGANSTIATSGLGDTSTAATAKKKLGA